MLNGTYVGKLVESAKQFVEKPHQLLRRALGRKNREADNVSKQDAANRQICFIKYYFSKNPYWTIDS